MSDYGHGLEFGVFISPSNENASGVVELAQLAEESNLDLVSFQDHPYQSKFLDTWTLISYLAAVTSRVKLAPNVLSLPLRQPAVAARSVASLDILSGGRIELGIGAGAFWDAIEAMGGRRLTPGQGVDALTEAIEIIRAIWDTDQRGGVKFEGEHYRLKGAARGPAPAHPVGIWIGAYKPRMLRLTGRTADGWIPSVPYLEPLDLDLAASRIDDAASEAGRRPADIRRLLNVSGSFSDGTPGPISGSIAEWPAQLTELAIEQGIGTFIAAADDPATIEAFAEVAPVVREMVERERAAAPEREPVPTFEGAEPEDLDRIGDDAAPSETDGGEITGEYARLGVTPTPDPGRVGGVVPWDESTRPHRPESGPEVEYSERGRQVGQHLIDVHDHLRTELTDLRSVVAQVRDGQVSAGEARSVLNEMAMRQNDWTLGAFCSRYCTAVTQHHNLEDVSVFPHLSRAEPDLEPVIDRLTEEHHAIHDAIEEVDRALVHHINNPGEFDRLRLAIDSLTDTLLSHLSYEELELVEPLARVGFQPGQV
ncbi:MAG TPA: LLM class flavin-dependent oxidoreductase [Solirubrobacterales bacterium]|nr:LLM class flavin-dependent oxidoreductase [Solirubrobacterales bacterium]